MHAGLGGRAADRQWWLPVSRHGLREMAWMTVLAALPALPLAIWWWPGAIAVGALWLCGILFFRDPARAIPRDERAYLAPADGKLTEITPVDHDDRIGGPAVRLGIFLSVFDVHINRSPCAGVVRSVEYTRGGFLNAMNPESSTENESNTLVLDAGPVMGTLVVKQIAGLIARRIVCATAVGNRLTAGQRFGMIKFGSRTELVLPKPDELEIVVRVGDKVHAGRTIMARRKGG
jgi:phosphatidylserine decarboxylase